MTAAEREAGSAPDAPPGPGEPWTVLRMIRWSATYLREKGIESGRLDAEHLLAESLELDRLDLYLQFDRPLTREELDAYRPLLRRRARREPLQYVLGRASFREIELTVDRRTLIPRPETEVLVQVALEWAGERDAEPEALEIGTGSGAVALSLAREGGFRRVVATDASADALELAEENRRALGLDDRVELREGSFYAPVRDGERFDLVVSNPPYVAEAEADGLAPEIREWEPAGALFAGPDGTEVLVRLVEEAPAVLRGGGLLALELAPHQGERLADRVRETGAFDEPRLRRDLAGRERILWAVRR